MNDEVRGHWERIVGGIGMRVPLVTVGTAAVWVMAASSLWAVPGTGLPPEKGGLCVVPSAANGRNVSVDCSSFLEWGNYYYGFATTPAEQCARITECVPWATDWFPFEDFGVTISRSATSLYDTIGPLSSDRLYLWVEVQYGAGWAAAEFGLAGTLRVREFRPAAGVLNAGTDTELLLAATCLPPGYHLLGEIVLESPVAVVPTSWGAVKSRYR